MQHATPPQNFELSLVLEGGNALGAYHLGVCQRLFELDLVPARIAILALDMKNGREIWFDTTERAIEPLHLLASTTFAPLFPPIEVEGRLLCDPGFANNVPLDRIFQQAPSRPVLCLAVDLFSIDHERPNTIDETLARVQDLGPPGPRSSFGLI